ncbi:hypothetical protein B0A79_21770 [Flavobacterium piscis]|uniref:Uncharacterized protein n=1 Tax=Flavobacterium piscis TaxID=1114874 RepID=A0ABX2XMI6_9FLAO|nr:hypothetical protein FLP_05460 [Flavobacterium piscis]OXE97452.1 hypothetical protein B0A79_21770 [Flavobacterium piscis]
MFYLKITVFNSGNIFKIIFVKILKTETENGDDFIFYRNLSFLSFNLILVFLDLHFSNLMKIRFKYYQ